MNYSAWLSWHTKEKRVNLTDITKYLDENTAKVVLDNMLKEKPSMQIADLVALSNDPVFGPHLLKMQATVVNGVVEARARKLKVPKGKMNLETAKHRLLMLLKGEGWVHSSSLKTERERIGINKNMFRRAMLDLTEEGLVERDGERQNTEYKITRRGGQTVKQ
jgi:hypothetical protein